MKKLRPNGSVENYKPKLVAQDFSHKPGINYFDVYAPVARITFIRVLIAVVSIHDLIVHQMDVKTGFLNGDLDEEICIKQPEGFIIFGHENKVCKLTRSLYGLKQAPKQWHLKFDYLIVTNSFHVNMFDECVYSKEYNGHIVILRLFVDEIFILELRN